MDKQCAHICEKLAGCVVRRDFNGAQALFAPWLRSALSPAAIEKMVDASNEGLPHPPHSWTIDEGIVEKWMICGGLTLMGRQRDASRAR